VSRELSVTEQRYQAVLSVIEDDLPVSEAAAKVGVTRRAAAGPNGTRPAAPRR
jgi:hypothetical protein